MIKGILVSRNFEPPSKLDHADLIAEMNSVENMPTQERLHLARMRRAQQLKTARQKEKEWHKLQRSQKHNLAYSKPRISRHITFENSVVLLEAASRNDIQEVANLLQRGITPDAANEDGLTALHQCCIDNNVEMLKLLLDYGANVDAQDSDKWTPLHAAATCGHLNLVKILINRGANLLAVNTDGNMPYDLCDDEETLDFIEAEMSKRGVTQELIDDTRALTEKQMLNDLMELANHGGDLEEPDHQGATPLHIASANGYTRVVEFLLEHHVNVDSMDKDLWSPVHAAACWGHLEVLELLAQFGADLYTKNKDDETPSDICEDPEIRERIELLKTEQESKRLAEQQRRRVRRSQSNNTRAQSVRRTSLRDKTLTTKKDAVEETRLRLQAQEVFIVPDSTTDPKSNESQIQKIPASTSSSSSAAATALPANSNTNNVSSSVLVQGSNTVVSGRRKSSTSSLVGQNHVTTTGSEITSTSNLHNEYSSDDRRLSAGGGSIVTNNNINGNIKGNVNSNGPSSTSMLTNNNNSKNHNNNITNINNSMTTTSNNNITSPAILNGGSGTFSSSSSSSSTKFYHQNTNYYSGSDKIDGNGRRPPEGKDNDEFGMRDQMDGGIDGSPVIINEIVNTGNGRIGNNSHHKITKTNTTTDRSTEIFQTSKENGKINVQVTVLVDTHNLDNPVSTISTNSPTNTSSAATLANLKKQRAQSRTSTNIHSENTTPSPTSMQHHHQHNHPNNILTQTNPTNSIPNQPNGGIEHSNTISNNSISDYSIVPIIPNQQQHILTSQQIQYNHSNNGTAIDIIGNNQSPAHQSITKYSGVTGDVVSDSTSSKKCCILM